MLELTGYRNLTRTIAVTDFKLKYQGSILGYLWSLVKPLLLFTVLYFVFTKVFKIGGTIPYYPVYLLLGIILWTFFSETSVACLFSIVSKYDLIRKVYFPRIVLIFSNSLTSLFTFLSNLMVVFVFMVFNHVPFTLNIVYIPLLLFELFIFVMGIGLFLGAFYVKFRDISHIWEVILFAGFYATPILYSPAMIPGIYKKILLLSPMAQIIQDFRYVLITNQAVTSESVLGWPYFIIPYVLPFVIFFFGYFVFEKMASKFAEEA